MSSGYLVNPNASSAHRLAIVLSFASLSASNCVLCVASAIVWRRACKKIAEEAAQVAAVEEPDLSQLTLRVFTHHEHDVEQDHVELSPSEVCSVCLCEFHGGQEITELVCYHRFHSGCIGTWLGGNGKLCPMRCAVNRFQKGHRQVGELSRTDGDAELPTSV